MAPSCGSRAADYIRVAGAVQAFSMVAVTARRVTHVDVLPLTGCWRVGKRCRGLAARLCGALPGVSFSVGEGGLLAAVATVVPV